MTKLYYLTFAVITLILPYQNIPKHALSGKWKAVKEVVKIKDAKINKTDVKTSNFVYDVLNFNTDKTVLITSGNETNSYNFTLKDKILKFTLNEKNIIYVVPKITKDSLILYRNENWGGKNTLSIEAELHFVKVKQ